MPSRRVLLLAALLFLIVLVLRLPAAWAVHWLPAPLTCDIPAGTLWDGHCAMLRVGGQSVSKVSWQLLPAELLHAKLGVKAQVNDPALSGSAKALFNVKGRVQGYDLLARLPVPGTLITGAPPGWSGQLEFDLPRFTAAGSTLQSVSGAVRVRGLQQAQPRTNFGDFEWQLADNALKDGRISGPLRDLGTALRLNGTLSVSLRGEYELNARVAAAVGADELVQRNLEQLGAADAQGFYQLSAAGTL